MLDILLLSAFLVSTNVLTDAQRDFVSRSSDDRRTVYLDKGFRQSLLKRAEKSATPVLPAAKVEAPIVILDPTVPNVRDFGGWRTADGRRIRRGRIFRSAGLNDNARDRKPTPADLAAADPEGALGSVREPVARLAARYAALTNDLSAMRIVRCEVPKAWRRVNLAEGLSALEAAVKFARGLPTEGGEELVVQDGCVTVGSLGPGKWAALSGTLTAEDEGFAVVRCAADWFWALAVNGVPVCDYLDGNRGSPAETRHEITIPVRRGANALTVIVGAGSSDYAFWFDSDTGGAKDGLVRRELDRLSALPETLCGHACGYEKGKSRITDANRAFWLGTLGIRSDIDLRSDRECRGMDGSPLGATVAWHHISSNAYGGMQTENGRKAFARVFRVFLDEKNYPIVFHCIAGQDRTGAVAYILGALLGMSENDLALDWELSAFANRSLGFSHARLYDNLVEGFRRHHPAPTVQESVEKYVLSLGFTRDDIARFRKAMLCGVRERQYDVAEPWAYWWWLNGNVSEASIARDLDELASAGFGGVVHVDPRGYWDDADHTVLPKSAMPVGGGRWTDLVAFSIRECAKRRLGFVCLDSSDAGELRDAASRRVDVRDPAAVRRHLDTWLGPLVARVGELVGTTWVGVTTASWEGDVAGWDPAEAGRIAEGYYGTERVWLGERGLELWGQLGGPWNRRVPFFAAADQLKFYSFADVPEGEFWSKWFGDNHGGSYHVRGVVSAAHVYGKPIVQAEAFTHMTRHWSKDPAQLKRSAVEAFADGVNRLVFHQWTCRDEAWGLPGSEYFAGTHFNGATTWSAHLKDFVAFVTRCQRLLQLGEPVVDIAIYAGPRPYQGGIGQGRLRYDPFGDGRVTVPRGYNYDVVNDDFLAGRAKGCGYACVVRAEGTNRVDVAKATNLPLPDCEGDVTFAHRRTADSDIYFVAGEGPQTLTFRVKGRRAALYDPVSGSERPLLADETSDGRTRVAVELPSRDGCAFVIFREPVEVKGPWQVTFRPATGRPPFERTFAALADWNESDDPDVRFFAGTATYRATVVVPSGERIAALAFGELGSGLAAVRVNGVVAQGGRSVWCAPWRADCRGLFRDGENTIEIDVTNNWMNRLVGDAALPPEERTTKSNLRLEPDGKGAFNDFSGYRAGDRLQPCGLRGPVELLAGTTVRISRR